ncbi:hypothetical protein QQP08_026515 [Theobroma cacao]|nr:hypothetical protein QQP08_025753 [Theobroma cacao]WRX34028.1 hypothetical protein QQP08_026515 [Theobroma cacao]
MKQFLSCRVKRLYLNAKNKLLGKKHRFPLLAWLGFSSKTTQGLRHGIRGGEFRKSKGCPSCQSKFKSYFGCLRGECWPETETMLRVFFKIIIIPVSVNSQLSPVGRGMKASSIAYPSCFIIQNLKLYVKGNGCLLLHSISPDGLICNSRGLNNGCKTLSCILAA